jgi:hypothetical protein
MTINPTFLAQRTRSCTFPSTPDLFRRPPGGIFNGVFAVERGANVVCLAVNWGDAKYRVLKSYREWLRAVSLPRSLYTNSLDAPLYTH